MSHDNDERMTKYGVDEDGSGTKTAEAQHGLCPRCGTELESVDEINVLKCPHCGTQPFEESR